jgi:two-component system sensor kinase FixL
VPASQYAVELQALLDATVDAVILIDHRGIMQQFNRSAERLFGYTSSEALGRNVSLLMNGGDGRQHDAYLDRYENSGVGHIIGIGREVQARRKDGSVFPAFLSVGRIADSNPPRFVGFLHDVTLRQQALEAVERERDRAKRYLEAAQTILVGLDPAHRITLINRKGCEVLGLEEEALLGSDWFDGLVAAEHRGTGRAEFDALLERVPRQPHYCEYSVVTRGGATRLIAWRCVVVEDNLGAVSGVLCSGDDVTEIRRADEEMRESRERIIKVSRLATMGEMAGGISHELNQPLAAIANYAQAARRLLVLPDADPADLQEALGQITDQAIRAGDIIRRLRGMVRDRESAREPCDLNEVITEMTPLVQADARGNDVRLVLELSNELPRVILDRIQMQQVLLNLLRNAIDALRGIPPERRQVVVRTAQNIPTAVQFEVIDNGPGVPEALRHQLFQRFVSSKDGGLGLGLAISRSIVEAHRGRLEYEPTVPQGATLRVTLPTVLVR